MSFRNMLVKSKPQPFFLGSVMVSVSIELLEGQYVNRKHEI